MHYHNRYDGATPETETERIEHVQTAQRNRKTDTENCAGYTQTIRTQLPPFSEKMFKETHFFSTHQKIMLKRLKLYFYNFHLTDDYFASILRAHNLNPYQDYDKTLHRVAMLQCVVQILSELAAKTNDNSLLTQIRYYQNDIAILKANGGNHE